MLLKNNLKIIWRSVRKNWGSNLLNITGLTLGILCSIIIFLTIQYERSFDEQHNNKHEIYRVTNNYYYPTFTMHVGETPDPMAEALRNDFPSFKNVIPIHSSFDHLISIADQTFESDILYCGPEFIEAFDYYNQPSQWIIGNPADILKEVNKTILTATVAKTYFGAYETAIGKIIKLNDDLEIEVAGIIKDPPSNTNYPFEQLVSYPTYQNFAGTSFGGVSSTTTFVQIPASVNIENLQPALDQFNAKYMETAWGKDFVSMALQPLSAIHFDERFSSNSYTINPTYLWILGLIGIFMLLVACINFVNLATAQSLSRAKEIGMRKILGSSKTNIVTQFMGQSFLLAFVALCLGTLLAQFSFPYFSELTSLNIGNSFTYNRDLLVFISGLLVFITLAMGVYPALLLSKFRPLDVVRQKISYAPFRGLTLRRGLIAFQLTISQILVLCAIVVTYQLQFFQNKELGFDKESILIVNMDGEESFEKKLAFKNKIQQFPFVQKTSLTSSIPMTGHHHSTGLTSNDSEIKDRFNVEYIFADNDYVEAMEMKLLAGKSTITNLAQDTVRGFVVNETLIKRLAFGAPEAAIGKRIMVNNSEAQIIGVVKDFHTLSLHETIKPVAIAYGMKRYSDLGIRYKTDQLSTSIAQVESAWKTVFPNKNFDYYFQDEQMGQMYENEARFSTLIKVFTFFSLFIACIGLIGLSSFTSVKRFKEIGIRKVLGASIPNILFLLSKEFILLTILGFVISLPIAYYLISLWLEGFAYRIQMEWWMVAVTVILTLLLTIITVGMQSMKTALVNPIKAIGTK